MASKLGRIFRNLLGPGDGQTAGQVSGPAVEYNGYTIRPASRREGSQWLTVGVISKELAGELKEHPFIRADMHASKEDADAFAVRKAKQIIDEQQNKLFPEG